MRENNGLIIESPDLQTIWMKYSYSVITFAIWGLWLYLWAPLLSLLAWFFGFSLFYEHMIELEGYKGFLKLLGLYALGITLLSSALLIWARYNQYRFRGKEKRRFAKPVTVEDKAIFFGIDEKDLARWRTMKSLKIRIDKKGDIMNVTTNGESKN